MVLVDTSALVAVFRAAEASHETCVVALRDLTPPFHTTWPVLNEAFYLLRESAEARRGLISLVRDGVVRVEALSPSFLDWYEAFIATYSDREVDLADASLVYLAERLDTNRVFTLDRRDFSVYRINRTGAFEILPRG